MRAEAEPYLRRAILVSSEIALEHPDDVLIQFELAKAHLNLGELLRKRGNVDQALEQHLKARAINEALVKAHPDQPRYRDNLAGNLVDLALAYEVVDPEKVEETYRASMAIYDKLVADYPENVDYRLGEAQCLRNFGLVVAAAERPGEAESIYRKVLELIAEKDGRTRSVERMRVQKTLYINLGDLQISNSPTGGGEECPSGAGHLPGTG